MRQTPADGGQLYDVQRYVDSFRKPRGAKPDPSDVILGSIAPPASPLLWHDWRFAQQISARLAGRSS